MSSKKIMPSTGLTVEPQSEPIEAKGGKVRKEKNLDNKLPDTCESEPEMTELTNRAAVTLKAAFEEGVKKLSLKPIYDWSAEHNITVSKVNKLLSLHKLVAKSTKKGSDFIFLQNRKINDPSVLSFIKALEKQVVQYNSQVKPLKQEKKRKVTRSGKQLLSPEDTDGLENISDMSDEPTTGNMFDSVDRKADNTTGLDSIRADHEVGPADVKKKKS